MRVPAEVPGLHMQWLNAKQGKSKALNLALFNSEGKYIIHIDSDGLLERSALRNMVYRFENDQSIECMSRGYFDRAEAGTGISVSLSTNFA